MKIKYSGACHCGAVRFEVQADPHLNLLRCNCTICTKSGYLHLIVPQANFTLLHGTEQLVTYRFGSMVAQHTFCSICGVKAFYIPRSNPDGVDINAHCLEPIPTEITITDFDGQNWEDNAATLSHLSQTDSNKS